MKELTIGKIVNTHGIKGEVRIFAETDFPEERFQVGNSLIFDNDQGLRETLTIRSAKEHKNFILLGFEGYDSINNVEKFKDGSLKITRDQQHELPEGEYYHHQILGLQVQSTQGEDLGTIREIMPLSIQDVWVIQPQEAGRKDILVPYHEEFVKDVDLDQQRITIELMEGLIPDEN